MFARTLAWAQKNERHLGGVVFLFGFITDLLTFTLLEVAVVNLFFIAYLALAASATFISHLIFALRTERIGPFLRTVQVLASLAAQYAIGGILSGCLIFYTKSSVLSVSWPFLVLIAAVFMGNEYFRKYRDHLAFQTILLFFALYAYAIFALPLYVHAIGPWVFAGSTLATLLLFSTFLFALSKTGATRLQESMRFIAVGALGTTILVVGAYATAIIPPLPLTLRDAGIYHDLKRAGTEYVLMAEEARAWWDIRPQTVHLTQTETAVAFASVFAPVAFSTAVVHHWERYDEVKKVWVSEGRITFPIAGGRGGGYRGYSEKGNLSTGKWRVTVETLSGQAIGRIPFTVVRVTLPVPLHEETH